MRRLGTIGTGTETGTDIGTGTGWKTGIARAVLCLAVLTLSACGSDRVYTLGEVGVPPEADEAGGLSSPPGAGDARETGMELIGAENPVVEGGSAPAASVPLYVYACGAVRSPGVYELPEGSRAWDALEAAGGFADGADTTYVNLARTLTDGEQLYFPTEEEVRERAALGSGAVEGSPGTAGSFPGETASGTASSGVGAEGSGTGALVNLNTADEAALCTLPGIGSAKARAILAYREEHGGFSSPEELLSVPGIGEASYARLKDSITVH